MTDDGSQVTMVVRVKRMLALRHPHDGGCCLEIVQRRRPVKREVQIEHKGGVNSAKKRERKRVEALGSRSRPLEAWRFVVVFREGPCKCTSQLGVEPRCKIVRRTLVDASSPGQVDSDFQCTRASVRPLQTGDWTGYSLAPPSR